MLVSVPKLPPSYAPLWVVYATVSLTILLIIDLLYRWLEPARLQVRVTKEVFVRWVERGEVLFVNAVMLATKAPVVVTDVRVSLVRTSGSSKSYALGVVLVGEKVKGDQVLAVHHFFTKSALEFVPGNSTHRRLYMCDLEEYSEASRAIASDFDRAVIDIRGRYFADPDSLAAMPAESQLEMVKEIDGVVNSFAERFFKRVQLETGNYELGLVVSYRRPSRVVFQRRTSTSSSRVRFEIRDDFEVLFRTGLVTCLRTKAVALIAPERSTITYPEYEPYGILELEES